MKRFRVLHIITRFILGGAQENTLLSVEGLRGYSRWEAFLATGPAEGAEGSLLERARNEGIHPIILRNLQREINPFRDAAAYMEIARLIRALKPHVVHTHSSKAGILGRLAAFHNRVPVIIHTIHGPSFHPFESPVRNTLFKFLERWTARRSSALPCVARAMARQYLEAGIGRPEQFLVIRSGMNVEPFLESRGDRMKTRESLGIPPGAFVFAKVSRIAPLKGHSDVLQAASEIKDQAPDLHLLFIGDGELSATIRREAEHLGLAGRLTFTGLVPPEKIPLLLRASDALVHASYREGLPRAVVQAGLAALPVVAYAVDGTPEAVRDGETGFLVEPGDVKTLARRMLDLASSPSAAEAMGRRARRMLKDEFDRHAMVKALDDLYVQQLRRKGVLPHSIPERSILDTEVNGT